MSLLCMGSPVRKYENVFRNSSPDELKDLMDIIKKELEKMNSNSDDNNIINEVVYMGSPFKGDWMYISYQTEMIMNIEKSVAEGKVIILSDLEQIYSTCLWFIQQKLYK